VPTKAIQVLDSGTHTLLISL